MAQNVEAAWERAVMDAAGIARAWLFGASEGGPMALLFATTYPERVEGLVLNGTGAHTAPVDLTDEEVARYHDGIESMAQQWGTSESRVAAGFAPSLAVDPTFVEWHQRYERLSADRDSLRELLELSLEVDMRSILSEIAVPTLVLHRRGDRIIPVEWGRALADGIPGAKLFETDGDDHFGYAGERDWIDEFERFVTGTVSAKPVANAQPVVHIETLGQFSVVIDGEAQPTSDWGSRLARQLCKRLVAARGLPVRREELFDLLWPDETDLRKLGARLSVQLSTVRRILGGGVIADRQTVALNLDEVSTDLELLFSDDDEAVVEAYAGVFLPDDLADEWTSAPREQARSAFVAAARRLVQQAQSTSGDDTVIDLARRMIVADRYDESAHRLLVETLRATGAESGLRRCGRSGGLRQTMRR
jgi:DNA-binding SARP family transcriptional activator